jgi:hypothetical protein
MCGMDEKEIDICGDRVLDESIWLHTHVDPSVNQKL